MRSRICGSGHYKVTKGEAQCLALPISNPMLILPKSIARILPPVLIALAIVLGPGALAVSPALVARAQTGNIEGPFVSVSVVPHSFDSDVRNLPRISPRERGEMLVPLRAPTKPSTGHGQSDPVVQTRAPTGAMLTPLVSFQGLDRQNWGSGVPADANGDVGPAHYIQTVNTSVGIFSKSGAQLAAFTFNAFWANLNSNTPCEDEHEGDPIVLYDASVERWMIADLAFGSSASGPYYFCIAVSKTSDPVAGGWWLYPFPADPSWLSDYPKIGVWRDGFYASANMFDMSSGGVFKGVRVWALDRSAMLLGEPFNAISFHISCVPDACYSSLLPGNFRGALPPEDSPNFFASIDEPNLFHLWKFHVDWSTPLNSTFTGPTDLTVANFVMPCGTGVILSCVPQKDVNEKVDGLGDRLMMQLQYRNFSGTESLWVNHTVAEDSAVGFPTGIRWYEIRDPSGAPTVLQQGTFQPDSNYRWMGSLAVDREGNMALGYSVSSANMHPAIRYAGRLATDTPGELSQGEQVLIEGAGSQSVSDRWGDYSAMTVDPVDDCTFWYTNQYLQVTGGNWLTRIGAFRFPGCMGGPTPTPTATPIACSGVPAKPSFVTPPSGSKVSTLQVLLDWNDVHCATKYKFVVKQGRDASTALLIERGRVTSSQHTTKVLEKGKQYLWRVKACNSFGCRVSKWWTFTIRRNAAAAAESN